VVGRFDLTLTVNDGRITYGDFGPFDFGYTLSSEALPYGETGAGLFGTLLYTPTDGCDFGTATSVLTQVQPSNYSVSYVDGALTVDPARLDLVVGDTFIGLGDPIPSFSVVATGLVCSDAQPSGLTFTIYDAASGNPVSGSLSEGAYQVRIDPGSVSGYEFYDINLVPGSLIINPEVGCNDRLTAADVCKIDNVTLEGDLRITTLVKFTVRNDLDVPIYIPVGNKNRFKGNAYFVFAEGSQPELFYPGETVIEVYTDGGSLQLELVSPGCNSASKSPNGSNANPCDTSVALGSKTEVDSFSREFSENIPKAYPNPATDYLTLFVGDMEGAVRVTVFDEVGRQLLSREYSAEGQDEVYLDISALKEGILMIRTENRGESSVFRIIKN
jgi:hypothetical protein